MNFVNRKSFIPLLVVGLFISGIGVSHLRAETVEQCIAKCEVDRRTDRRNAVIVLAALTIGCSALLLSPFTAVGYFPCQIGADAIFVGSMAVAESTYLGCKEKCNIE